MCFAITEKMCTRRMVIVRVCTRCLPLLKYVVYILPLLVCMCANTPFLLSHGSELNVMCTWLWGLKGRLQRKAETCDRGGKKMIGSTCHIGP